MTETNASCSYFARLTQITSSNSSSSALVGVSRVCSRPGRCTITLRSVPTSDSTDNDAARSSCSVMAGLPLFIVGRGKLGQHLRATMAAEQLVDLVEAPDHAAPAGPLDEAANRLDLRAHRAGGEVLAAKLGWRSLADRPLGWGAVVHIDGVDVGGQHQGVDAQVDGQQRRGKILVDHGLDPPLPAVSLLDDGDPAAARADDEKPGFGQALDRAQLNDPLRLRRGHDAAPAAPVRLDRPPVLLRQGLGVGFGIDRTDELRRG